MIELTQDQWDELVAAEHDVRMWQKTADDFAGHAGKRDTAGLEPLVYRLESRRVMPGDGAAATPNMVIPLSVVVDVANDGLQAAEDAYRALCGSLGVRVARRIKAGDVHHRDHHGTWVIVDPSEAQHGVSIEVEPPGVVTMHPDGSTTRAVHVVNADDPEFGAITADLSEGWTSVWIDFERGGTFKIERPRETAAELVRLADIVDATRTR